MCTTTKTAAGTRTRSVAPLWPNVRVLSQETISYLGQSCTCTISECYLSSTTILARTIDVAVAVAAAPALLLM
jgi:hypothetical protein